MQIFLDTADVKEIRELASLGLVDETEGRIFLIDATPDLPSQLVTLTGRADRRPVVDGILITHAHVGHYAGLMYLGREALGASGIPVHATPRMARLLRENNYLSDCKELELEGRAVLRLYLRYHNDLPVVRELQRVSSPGLRRYVKCRDLPRIKNGLGVAIVSTSRGVMTDRKARADGVGGEVLCIVA